MLVKGSNGRNTLQTCSVVVALLVALSFGGTLIPIAWDNFNSFGSSHGEVIGPLIGVIIFLALASLIAAPVRFYRILLIKVVGGLLGVFLIVSGIFYGISAFSQTMAYASFESPFMLFYMSFMACSSGAIMLIKVFRARKMKLAEHHETWDDR